MSQQDKQGRPPQRGRPIIDRPRLLAKLELAEGRTILLIAPAGYGKTLLLRQWGRARPEMIWYIADASATDPAGFAIGLARALEPVCPTLPAHLEQLLLALSNPTRQLARIVDAFLPALAGPALHALVIDDYHVLAESAACERFVRAIRNRMEGCLIVASRSRPAWANARAELYGAVVEIGMDELAFTPNEVTEVLSERHATLKTRLLREAQGWPAVVGIAAVVETPEGRPENMLLPTLFRFFAEELFSAAPVVLQDRLQTLALLPSLSPITTREVFGKDAPILLDEALTRGFASMGDRDPEFHPLIREYLLSKLAGRDDMHARVNDAVALSLRLHDFSHAFALIMLFDRPDLLSAFIESAFRPLIRAGRVQTLEQVSAYAKSHGLDLAPLVTLIDAELAFRDGALERAQSLASYAAETIEARHALASRAHLLSGQALHLAADYIAASERFRIAHATAQESDDAREALWALTVTAIFSETADVSDAISELKHRRNDSPTDLLRATAGEMMYRRYSDGVAQPLDVEHAMHVLNSVPDVRVRTSFVHIHAYEQMLKANYDVGRRFAEQGYEEAKHYQLAWSLPYFEWIIAACSLGSRDFTTAARFLRRLERVAHATDDGHSILNAAVLRARLLLATQRPHEARDALLIDDNRRANPAMKAEFLATTALVRAVLGDTDAAAANAAQAVEMTEAVEVHAFAAAVGAVCHHNRAATLEAFHTASRLGVWDGFVCAIRSAPALLEILADNEECRPSLQTLLIRTRDFDLARRAGIEIGQRLRFREAKLSPREIEILQLVKQGLKNREIAKMLFISEATVKVHIRHIREKTGTRSRTEAAAQIVIDS